MKKKLGIILVVCLIAILSLSIYAEAPGPDPIPDTTGTYAIEIDGSNCTIRGYNGAGGNVTIPDTLEYDGNTYTVTSIGNDAFYQCTSLENITIPDDVTGIGEGAFSGCSNLKSIIIPKDVKRIENYTFYECTSFENITIPDDVESIGNSAFSGCTNLKSIIISDDVTSIGEFAFSSCTSLENITIPEKVTSIGQYAFAYCDQLTSITIPKDVTSIEEGTFSGCSSITSITIPDKVTNIGNDAFLECSVLRNITIPNSVTSIGSNIFTDGSIMEIYVFTGSTGHQYCKDDSIPYKCFIEMTAAINNENPKYGDELTINITNENSDADSFTYQWYRGADAIVGATNATYTVVKEDINKTLKVIIGADDCVGTIESTTNIVEKAIAIVTPGPIEKDTITHNRISIKEQADCEYSIDGGNNWQDSPEFTGLTPYTEYTLSIRKKETETHQASEGRSTTCSTLAQLDSTSNYRFAVDGTNCTIVEYEGAGGNIAIPNTLSDGINTYTVTSIGEYAFFRCENITSVTIPEDVTSIGAGIFANCSSLESITIPNKVTTIGNSTFAGCSKLESITLHDDITSIGEEAFIDCSSLESITIPNKVTTIEGATFSGCFNLTSITLHDDITSIGEGAFNRCISLESITIPNKVTTIGNNTFGSCSDLTSITLHDDITSIGEYAFSGCFNLRSITLSGEIVSIGTDAFENCNALNARVLKDSYAHTYCTTNNITCTALEEFTGTVAIDNTNPKYNDGLTASVTDDNSATDNFTYQWYRGEVAIENASDATYTVVQEDIGKQLKVTVKADDCIGSIESSATNIVEKAVAVNPDPIEIDTITHNRISIKEQADCEYSIDGGNNWQDSPEFTGLTPYTEYTLSIRKKETETYQASEGRSTTCSTLAQLDTTNSYRFVMDGDNCTIVEYTGTGGDVIIPDTLSDGTDTYTVTGIGEGAFRSCRSLESITIPNKVTRIEDGTFFDCSKLESITLHDDITSIGSRAFTLCSSLESITIPNKVTRIENGTFSECGNLTSITLHDDITGIGGEAFYSCRSLESITIPNKVTRIENSTFSYCSSLESITIPNKVTRIENSTFFGCSKLESITLHDDITSIGEEAFSGCSNLTSITLSKKIVSIGTDAFINCNALNARVLKDSYAHTYCTTNNITCIALEEFTGTVAIDNTNPKYNDGLTASVTDDNSATDTFTYQWYRGEVAIENASDATYTVVQEDIGKQLKVTVKTDDCIGSLESSVTNTVEKAVAVNPDPIEIDTITHNRISIKEQADCEYSIDNGVNWQESPEFKGLSQKTTYTISIRKKEDLYQASAVVTGEFSTLSKPSDGGNSSNSGGSSSSSGNSNPSIEPVEGLEIISESKKGQNIPINIKNNDISVTFNGEAFGDVKGKKVQAKIETLDKKELDISQELKDKIGDLPVIDVSVYVDSKKIDFESDEAITIEVPVPENYEGHKIVAVYIDDDGNIEIMDGVVVEGLMKFTTNHLSHYALMYSDKTFEDITTHWSQEAVEALTAREVIKGKSDTVYDPDGEITRAEFTALMVRYFGFDNDSNSNFSDVEAGKWYTEDVAIAKGENILPSIYEDTFEAHKAITREEMMYILYKALEKSNKLELFEDNGDQLQDFVDSNDISDYALDSGKYLVARDIINGTDNNAINPKATSTRGEVAQILYNLLIEESK